MTAPSAFRRQVSINFLVTVKCCSVFNPLASVSFAFDFSLTSDSPETAQELLQIRTSHSHAISVAEFMSEN